MRAARYDAQVVTGSTWSRAVQVWRPQETLTLVGDLVVGDRVFYNRLPERVAVVDPNVKPGLVQIHLRDGLWSDPYFDAAPSTSCAKAEQLAILDVAAAFTTWSRVEVNPLVWPPDPGQPSPGWHRTAVEIPSEVIDGKTAWCGFTADQANALTEDVGSWSWDLYADVETMGWTRLLEGSFAVQLGDSRNGLPIAQRVRT